MISFMYTCDSCGKKGQGSVRGLTAILLPPDGWKWCFQGPLWGPHACSVKCWDKVKLSPDGKLYLDWDHESEAGKADWQQSKSAAPAPAAAPPPPKVKATRKHPLRDKVEALDGRVAALGVTVIKGTHLIVQAEVRYWEDASVNGFEDLDGSLVPLRNGLNWCPVIELSTGKIADWPQGTTAEIHYKVCDQGEYWLADSTGAKVAKWKGYYVPDDLLCVGDRGYGDYIIFNVGADGAIAGWMPPKIDPSEWTTLPAPTV